MSSRRALFAVAFASLLSAGPAAAAEVEPGMVITKENMAVAADLLAPSMQWMIARGLEIEVGDYRKVEWPSKYKEATEKYASQVKLAADGRSIEGYVSGLPFPDIDPNDPWAGTKVMWNQELKPIYTDDVQTEFVFELTDASGDIERTQIWDRWRRLFWSGRLYHDPKPVIEHEPAIRYTELFGPALAPEDIRNTGALSIRYRDPDIPDDTYLYLPQLRRVRRVPVNNRTDSVFGTDMVLDSVWGFASKIGNFRFKLLAAEQEVLAAAHSGKYATEDLYAAPPGSGMKAWMPNGTWEKRTVWVVQGDPQIRPYAFTKGVFYVDREYWHANLSEWYDKRGELWKIWWNMFNFTSEPTPGQIFTEPGTGLRVDRATTPSGMQADLQAMHATKWRAPSPYGMKRGNEWRFDAGASGDNVAEYHTVSHMVEIGR